MNGIYILLFCTLQNMFISSSVKNILLSNDFYCETYFLTLVKIYIPVFQCSHFAVIIHTAHFKYNFIA